MSLLNKILQKKDLDEYFLILAIEEYRICAGIARIFEDNITLIGTGESEWSSSENEIEAADIAISAAESKLPEGILVEKVIFGLPQTFLSEDKIKPEQMKKIGKIIKELALKEQGFVEYPQALTYYLERIEETPPTTFLLSVGRNNLIFSLIRVGRVEKNLIVDRTDSLITDFGKALKNFRDEILPSRIILYDEANQGQMERIREELMSFPWVKHSSFLHTPKIEIIPPITIVQAIIESVGSTLLKNLEIKETGQKEDPIIAKLKEEFITRDNFGFVKGEDVALTEVEVHQAKAEDISEQTPKIAVPKKVLPSLPKINFLDKLTAIKNKIPKINLPANNLLPVISSIVIIIIIFGLGFLSLWHIPKSTVKLIVYPVVTTQKIPVQFTTDPSKLNSENNILLATILSNEASSDKTIPTTGKNKIGEAARGEAVIYNKTLNSKTFPKGTIILNGVLRFTLDSDTPVASASDTGEGLVFSKTAAKITAVEIGPESNLTTGSIFTFKDFPESYFYAKTSAALSGGTSRDIASVAKTDQDQLLSILTEELTARTKQELISKLAPQEKLLDGSIQKEVISKKFSKEVGSEAKELTLTVNLKITALIYKEDDLSKMAQNEKVGSKPGFSLDQKRKNVRLTDIKNDKKGNTIAQAHITSFFLPEMDTLKIAALLKGKTYSQADNILKDIPALSGFEIIDDAGLPFVKNRLPLKVDNISIQIVPR